jgi:hypothetical protein
MNMPNWIHKDLIASGRWFKFSLVEQMANIGSDVGRAIQWRAKGDLKASRHALDRALEQIDFTVADPKNKNRLREILRVREFLADYFIGDNQYGFTDDSWQRYFYYFGYAAALQRGR